MKKKDFFKFMLIALVAVSVSLAGCAGNKKDEASENNASLSANEVKLGIEKVESGDLDNGMAHFEKAMEYDPENPRAWCGMGTVYRLRDKFDEAIEHYNKALELNPEYQICLDNMGVAYTYKGDAEKALEYFNKAMAIDAQYADVYFNMGVLYDREGATEKAISSFENYLKYSSDDKKKKEVETALAKMKEKMAEEVATEE